MSARLASASVNAEECGDVYRGLARVCSGDLGTCQTVMVCVDGLGSAELEFFSVVSRHRRDIVVYVYGDERSAGRIAEAIKLGAIGPVTDDLVHAVLSAEDREAAETPPLVGRMVAPVREPTDERLVSLRPDGPPREDEVAPLVAVDGGTPAASGQPLPEDEPAVPHPDGKPAAPDFHAGEKDEMPVQPARVPWLHYSGRPPRTPPRVHPPPAEATGPVEPIRSRRSSCEPLLTEAELQALLGDDIATIAPEENTPVQQDRTEDPGDSP